MSHPHINSDEMHVYYVPADLSVKPGMKVIKNDHQAMMHLVGGYIERVSTAFMPTLECRCQMVMVVNEEGLIRGLPDNFRAGQFYPGPIVGDVFFLGEGPVRDLKTGEVDIDWFSLPAQFHHWEGPGHPVPQATSLID